MIFTRIILCLSFCILATVASAQQPVKEGLKKDSIYIPNADSSRFLHINLVAVTGNKRTKAFIIKREMGLKAGDSIRLAAFPKALLQSQNQVYNTNLFDDVRLSHLFLTDDTLNIYVLVRERWYIYPAPKFQIVDRSYQEWIKLYDADLNRVIYGAKFTHYNLSGRRDQVRMTAYSGYARNVAVSYTNPYSNKKLNEGFSVGASYTQFREVIYKTSHDNKFLQFKNGDFVRNNFSVFGSYISRKGFFRKKTFTLVVNANGVNDSVVNKKYNPAYLGGGVSKRVYPDLVYTYNYSNTNNINYPLSGTIYSMEVLKRGLGLKGGINMLSLSANYVNYFGLGKNWYASVQGSAKLKLPFKQPYVNQRAIGFDNFIVRGLDYYVIDGAAAAVTQFTLKKKLISFNIPVPIKNNFIPRIPFTFFAKTFADFGTAYSVEKERAMLNNKLLYTAGIGLDVLTFYDFSIGVDYSINQLNEKGLFLRVKTAF